MIRSLSLWTLVYWLVATIFVYRAGIIGDCIGVEVDPVYEAGIREMRLRTALMFALAYFAIFGAILLIRYLRRAKKTG